MFCKTEKLMLALHAGRQPLVGIYRTILDLQHFYVGHFNFLLFFLVWLLPGKVLYVYILITYLMPVVGVKVFLLGTL